MSRFTYIDRIPKTVYVGPGPRYTTNAELVVLIQLGMIMIYSLTVWVTLGRSFERCAGIGVIWYTIFSVVSILVPFRPSYFAAWTAVQPVLVVAMIHYT